MSNQRFNYVSYLMKIFVVTTCVTGSPVRDAQYVRCIGRLLALAPEDAAVVIVEGNGPRQTCLDGIAAADSLGRTRVIYTHNNLIGITNKGHAELLDVWAALESIRALPDDFIIKLTGRYFIEDPDAMFAGLLTAAAAGKPACVKFGSFLAPADTLSQEASPDCVTGLIGMRAGLVRGVHTPRPGECAEWLWAARALAVRDPAVAWRGKMGLSLCPGCDEYFTI
jgi:hypothetical protein